MVRWLNSEMAKSQVSVGYKDMTQLCLHSKLLNAVPHVAHGFGLRGVSVADSLDAMGIPDRFLFETDQVHGACVHYLAWPKKGPKLAGDAFISDRPGLVCFVRTADCVPILIAEANGAAVAAVHAGWRGTAEDVVGTTLRAMQTTFGIDPADCVAAIGPHICSSCYEVGPEVIAAFEGLGIDEGWRADERHVDLGAANHAFLMRAGIAPDRIETVGPCTFCDTRFSSWRRDQDADERQFSFVLLAETPA